MSQIEKKKERSLKKALIICNGSPPPQTLLKHLWRDSDYRVSADGGANLLHVLTCLAQTVDDRIIFSPIWKFCLNILAMHVLSFGLRWNVWSLFWTHGKRISLQEQLFHCSLFSEEQRELFLRV